jgi:hypothetical protein
MKLFATILFMSLLERCFESGDDYTGKWVSQFGRSDYLTIEPYGKNQYLVEYDYPDSLIHMEHICTFSAHGFRLPEGGGYIACVTHGDSLIIYPKRLLGLFVRN